MLSVYRHYNNWQKLLEVTRITLGCFCLLAGVTLNTTSAADSTASAENIRLSEQIDALIAEAHARERVNPAPRSSDAEFMRRVSLDLTGKIPPVAELRAFLADTNPDKRALLIDSLLESPGFVVHFTNSWRDLLLPGAATDQQAQGAMPEFEAWLRSQWQENVRYDQLVRDLINVPLTAAAEGLTSGTVPEVTPRAFYTTKQFKPESLASGTSRAFLGVRLECAQCHDHPFDHWKQDQFWQFAAFFSNIDLRQQNAAEVREVTEKPRIKIPDTNRLVDAAFLDATSPEWDGIQLNPRERLADWVTSSHNPYFARATANRIWSLFFGRGLIDPVDDLSALNPASHPKLLDLLARRFQEQDYDLKYLIREITNSQTYQRTSRQTDTSQSRGEWYGKMPTRGLTAEQIFANLVQATGFFRQTAESERLRGGLGAGTPQSEFYELFKSDAENQLEPKASILQALTLMNGTFITNATSLEESDVFTAIVEFPGQSVEKKVTAFYLTTLSRFPRDAELARLSALIEAEESPESRTHAYSDLFWALLNSSEFLLNH